MYINKLSPLVMFFVFLIGCQPSGTGNKLADLEKAVAENPTAEATQQLLGMYQSVLQDTEKDATAKAETVGKLAQLQLKNNQVQDAIQTLKSGISTYYAAPATASNLWSLGQIFKDRVKSAPVGNTINKLYVKQFPTGAQANAAKQALAQDATSISAHLDSLGSKMYNEETHRLDTKAAGDFIESCELFALLQPEDPQSPDYLHKAGETARAIRAFPRAIGIYDRIYAKYPQFEKAPQALFLKAFTYDNDLKDFAKARTLYTEFLEKFPNDDFADDTQFLLKNLGKSDEEIIQSFGGEKKAN